MGIADSISPDKIGYLSGKYTLAKQIIGFKQGKLGEMKWLGMCRSD